MVEEMKIKDGYKKTEVGVIPEDWEIATILDICKIFGRIGYRGYTKEDIVEKEYGAISLSPSNIVNNSLSIDKCTYISWRKYEESPEIKIYNGDVVIVKTGSTYGKSTLVKGLLSKATINPQLIVFKELTINNVLFLHILNMPLIKNQIESAIVGGAIPTLSQEKVYNFKLVIPKQIKEQKAIATVLSDMDDLIESTQKLIDKKKKIKQGTMQELLTGKKRLDGFSGDWEVKKLGEIVDFYKGKGLPKSEIIIEGQYKCIHYGELFTFYKEKINKIFNKTNNIQNKFLSKKNDILMPTSDVTPNGLAKASCILENGIILGGDILVIRGNYKEIDGVFLSYLIRSDKVQIMQLVTGTTVYHLYASDMKEFKFKLPPLKEQKAIAQILSDMDSEIELLQEKLQKYKTIKKGMMQELLTGRIRLV